MTHITAIILAAGGSRRFSGIKLLAETDGKSLLAHSVAVAETVLPDRVCVVLGAYQQQLRPHTGTARVIDNDRWEQGLSSSIAAGIASLDEDCDHVLLLLADQPGVRPAALGRLIDRHLSDSPAGITCALYRGLPGIPAIFSRRWFGALASLSGDKGARDLLRDGDIPVATVDMPEAAVDIDTPADLAAWRTDPLPDGRD